MTDFMERYEEAIAHPMGTRDGALMLAVYRGKVSEGLDFTDDKARCVICVGIPFPAALDELVLQKKRFNDAARANELRMGNGQAKCTLISGDDWYSTQAYRAYNQA